ncbi:MAG: hypothetical protein IT432_11340 [Phycisphaerales bacterium]|nr:hypothetical protein [Phycisphaerales bacterium]
MDIAALVEFLGGGTADHGRESTPDELGDERGGNGDFDMIVADVEAGFASEVAFEASGAEFTREAVAETAHVVVMTGDRACEDRTRMVLAGLGD